MAEKDILVVDDDPDLLQLVRMVLTNNGYSVRTADNGSQALEAVARRMPDLILLDMRMPVMNGWEFARELRARHERIPPLMVVTAAEDAAARASEIGARGFIAKPFNVGQILESVRREVG
jgi:CheY-like chemotaxis protein